MDQVRQKERGLRGSWHAGTIVGLKAGGRLVEYDELLSEDGLGKLRESIPSPPQLHMQSRKRGILRPIPSPVPPPIAPFSLKGGLFVDVFFQDAWWEAVLLDDVVSLEDNAYVNVIYPDEGDLARVQVKDLRISQLWDEVTGEWNLKGSCNLSRFLKRRGITRKETVPTTSTDFEGSQADQYQVSFVQSKSKRDCSFLDVGQPGGNATTSALSLDMTHYAQGAARAAVLGENCSGGTESSDQQLDSDQSSNAKFMNQEPPQSTCPESGRVDMPSFALHSSNLVEVTGFSDRNEVAAFEGPECLKCNNYDPKACIDSSQLKDFGKERGATEQHITTLLAKQKAIDCVKSQRSDTEVYVSPCEEAGESLVSHPLLPSAIPQGDGYKDPCEKQEDLFVSSSNNASPCEKQTNSFVVLPLLPSPSPQGEFCAHSCRNETDMAVSTPSPEGHLHLVCESKQRQCFSLPGELVDCTNAHLSMSNSQGHLDCMCEEKQHKWDVSMGQCLERGEASSKSNIHKNVQVDMDAGNSVCLSTPSQTDIDQQPVVAIKLDYLEEGALSCMDRACSGGQSCINKITELMEVNVVSDNKNLSSEKEISLVKTQVDCAVVDCRGKRKAKVAPQEMKMRTGLRDKHRNHDSLSDDKTEKRLETDTLRSFRDRLLLQKQADAAKKKALETSRGLEKVEKIEKKDFDLQLLSGLNCTEAVSKSSLKAPMVKGKSLRILTRDIAKKALLEAGFTIDLRPRRSRDYQDAVYVSPEGHSHWSLPKAWKALKKSQAEKRLASSEQGCSKNAGHEKGAMSLTHGEEGRQSLVKADKSALKQVFSRFGNDERLQSALTKLGTCSRTHLEMAQDATRQAELTNADLTDILLGDLGVLRRFTKKFLSENELNDINSADSRTPRSLAADFIDKTGKKRKRESAHALEISDRRLLDGRGFPRKLQGDSFSRSREDKIQGTARSSKQTSTETKLAGSKHKTKKGKKPKARSGFRLEVRRPSSTGCEEPVCHSRRTVFAWMLDRGAVLERERIFFVDPINNQVSKEGVVTREGILCSCCKRVYTVQSFEAHAGGHVGDWHKALVFTSGKCLLDCQLKAWDAEIHLRKAHNYIGVTEEDTNDDTCVLCGDGGDLICCDGCPSTFHASCLQIDNVPEGNWYCPKCSCGTCGGRQHGEQQEDPAVILCNQCKHRYHIACLARGHSIVGKEVFCGPSCGKIFSTLKGLVGIANPLGRGFSWTLLRCMEEDKVAQIIDSTVAIDYHSKLAVALLVIKECFNPMVDPRTNIDMITHAMYNRWSDFDRLNYSGFYTAVLEKEGEIISVASIRIHGVRLAEMPLIGTREKFRRQGMCRLLVGVIEKLLCSLEVDLFILPAIPELFETWTHAFGFKPLDQCLKSKLLDISMMVFPGTELLQKPLSTILTRDAVVG